MSENEHSEGKFYYPEDTDVSCLHNENVEDNKVYKDKRICVYIKEFKMPYNKLLINLDSLV